MKEFNLSINAALTPISQANIKAALLSHGVALSQQFIENYGYPFLEKRRAYGNSDPDKYHHIVVPQELFLRPSGLVCSVNIRPKSKWYLDYLEGEFVLCSPVHGVISVDFPRRPGFYNFALSSGEKVNSIATLYGGGALGIFVYGACSLVERNVACKYCSIKPNRAVQTDFLGVITPKQVYEAVKISLASDPEVISQVMINGGNFKDGDKSFLYYIQICNAARQAIKESGQDVELHLIAYPPQNLSYFESLADLDVSLAMNIEVFSEEKFRYYCPGKDQKQILDALTVASQTLGLGRVFSIFVGGLESVEIMRNGFDVLAGKGVTPIVNIFHPDPGTALENDAAPSVDSIIEMGKLLQETYAANDFMTPFYYGCGRNAIDTEAFLKLF